MVFPIAGGTQETGYNIDNSLMFNDGDNAYLSITPSSAGNRRTFTYSAWIKLAVAGATSRALLSCGTDSGSNDYILFQSGDKLRFSFATEASGDIITSRLFRDPSAWYHIVWAVDTTQGTASNRVKLYVNGTQATDVSGTYPSQNYDTAFNNTEVQRIGARAYSATQYYDGYMSDVHLIDGQQLDASYFGETNENGVWIPKKYLGTYGTNGFKLEFKQTGTSANSSGIGADTSGNDNHFSLGTGNNPFDGDDIMTDSPTNNFATWNTLQQNTADPMTGFSHGNLAVTETSNADWSTCTATQAVANGKWYFEVRLNNLSGSVMVGVLRQAYASTTLQKTSNAYMGSNSGDLSFGYRENGTFYYNGSTDSGNTTFGSNDIVMIALDMDNGAIYTGKNGTWNDSGDPTSGSSKTGASYTGISAGEFYSPAVSASASDVDALGNFGNVYGSYSMSSANTDGLYGEFEYAPPSGYYAICTKRIAEYG